MTVAGLITPVTSAFGLSGSDLIPRATKAVELCVSALALLTPATRSKLLALVLTDTLRLSTGSTAQNKLLGLVGMWTPPVGLQPGEVTLLPSSGTYEVYVTADVGVAWAKAEGDQVT
jgi:hypothetical protein